MHNTKLAGAIFSALFLSAVNVNAAPFQPVPGTATVDGYYSEWNLSTDFAAKMCEAGKVDHATGECDGKEHLSNLYLRYDCKTNTMYALVLREGNFWPHEQEENAWIKVYDLEQSPQVDGNSSNFSWVAPNGTEEVDLFGYEASFSLAAGSYQMETHIQIKKDRTSSTGKKQDPMLITVPEDCEMPPTTSACDYIYAVHDGGLNDSQILRYKADSGIESLGNELAGYDIEAVDISLDEVLYGASGDDTDKPGYLYTIDMGTGAILSANPTGCNELDGISFNPKDGSLWGWDQDQGLVEIIDGTCSTPTVANDNGYEVEDLTWNNAGDTLYFAYNDHNGADPDKGNDSSATYHIGKFPGDNAPVDWNVCDIAASEIEALEVLNDGTILVGYHQNGDDLVAKVDLSTCETTSSVETNYDIEGIAACLPTAPVFIPNEIMLGTHHVWDWENDNDIIVLKDDGSASYNGVEGTFVVEVFWEDEFEMEGMVNLQIGNEVKEVYFVMIPDWSLIEFYNDFL